MASSSSNGNTIPVELNVYDLIVPNLPQWGAASLYAFGCGFFHSGVSIYGTEYCYGGHEQPTTGVFEVTPKEAPEAKFRETIIIGHTSMSPIDVALLINQMAASTLWRGNNYNLLTRNCNHFASDLCEKLTGNSAPGWINRLAWMGDKVKVLLPDGIEKPMAAPVQAQHMRGRRDDDDPDASD